MEMWLKTSGKQFRFPVLPQAFNINGSSIINTANITKSGEVSMYGGNGLRTTEITSFFPNNDYGFNAYKPVPKPYDCVKEIETWRNKGQDIRFIITDTDINMLCYIESFEYGEQDGTRDVYFSIKLVECRVPTVKKDDPIVEKPDENKPRPEPPTPETKRTHKVKKGDCLWDIAQKYYGNGKLYKKIKEANWDTYPSLKKNNIIYSQGSKAMTLVIP